MIPTALSQKKRIAGFLELPTILGLGLVGSVRAGYPVGLARHHHEQRLRFDSIGLPGCMLLSFVGVSQLTD